MLTVAEEIFKTQSIEVDSTGQRTRLHSNASLEQCLFIQEMFDIANPINTIEVGLAYGISTLFILEKHHEYGSKDGAHLVIEPFPWGQAAMHNFKKAKVDQYVNIINKLSDQVLPELYNKNHRIQLAFIDTTKLFDVVMHDFYFIDKILDINGVIIFDDCDSSGINLVIRFVKELDNYQIIGTVGRNSYSFKRRLFNKFIRSLVKIIPFKNFVFPNYNFITNEELGINYRCVAFKKIRMDERNWDAPQKL